MLKKNSRDTFGFCYHISYSVYETRVDAGLTYFYRLDCRVSDGLVARAFGDE